MARTLYDYLNRNAKFFRDRPALTVDGDGRITFAQLKTLTDEVIALLKRADVQRGDRIALWMPNSIEWVSIFLAAAATGAVAVPINTRLTANEMAAIMAGALPRLVFASARYRGREYYAEAIGALHVATTMPTVVEIVGGVGPSGWCMTGRPAPKTDNRELPSGLFSVNFTSGTSTGHPKGVMLTHDNYLSTADYASRLKQVTHNTDFVSPGLFFHTSGSMHCISVCMVSAATLHTMSIWDPEKYLDLVARNRATVSHAPLLSDVFDLGSAAKAREKLETLKTSTVIGTTAFKIKVVEELGVPNVFEPYGMTETCGMFTMCSADDPHDVKMTSQGRPHIGNKLRIVDPDRGEVGPGEVGEIQLSGIGVTPGYFSNLSVNKQAFTDDGWLKTGDVGKVADDGALKFVSRIKDIIKTGGENFTSAEVEQAFMELGLVKEVAVFSLPDRRLNEIPVAVVVPFAGRSVEWSSAMNQLRGKLADFKVPKQLYVAEGFSKTSTDKVQKSILKDWVLAEKLLRVL